MSESAEQDDTCHRVGGRVPTPARDVEVVCRSHEPRPFQVETHEFGAVVLDPRSPLRQTPGDPPSITLRDPPTWTEPVCHGRGVLLTAPHKRGTVRLVDTPQLRDAWLSTVLEEAYRVRWVTPATAVAQMVTKLHSETGPYPSPEALRTAFRRWCEGRPDASTIPPTLFTEHHAAGAAEVAAHLVPVVCTWLRSQHPAYLWHHPTEWLPGTGTDTPSAGADAIRETETGTGTETATETPRQTTTLADR